LRTYRSPSGFGGWKGGKRTETPCCVRVRRVVVDVVHISRDSVCVTRGISIPLEDHAISCAYLQYAEL
jgi:hypothetical protein